MVYVTNKTSKSTFPWSVIAHQALPESVSHYTTSPVLLASLSRTKGQIQEVSIWEIIIRNLYFQQHRSLVVPVSSFEFMKTITIRRCIVKI